MTSQILIEREVDFPRVIVWDALVDEDLVAGWLAVAHIEPELGGRYDLTWMHKSQNPVTSGEITAFDSLERLQVETSDSGVLSFVLEEREGGSRGTTTRLILSVDIDVEPAFLARVRVDWLVCLDQLSELLQGHPVDWANWDRDRHEAWTRHLNELRGTAG